MDNQIIQETVDKILSVLPNQAGQLARLVRLMQFACDPTITVIGKYNHGKSRLLNELIGTDIFSVADKRETIQLAEHKQDQVRWLDAPGLDADVAAVDDRHAFEAVWTQADIRLFVHSVREGELDATEHHLLQQL
ncbi:GTPase domain-containing protein, partial [Acinetobacter nosocomialis]